MKRTHVFLLILVTILLVFAVGLCVLTQNLDWRLPNSLDEMAKLWDSFWTFNAFFSSLALGSALYAIYSQIDDRKVESQRRKSNIEPRLSITHESRNNFSWPEYRTIIIYIADKDNMIKGVPHIEESSWNFRSLEMNYTGEKYQVVAHFYAGENPRFRFIYKDIDSNHYEKEFTCAPYGKNDII